MTQGQREVSSTQREASMDGLASEQGRSLPTGPAFSYFQQDEDAKARGLFTLLSEEGKFDRENTKQFTKEFSLKLYNGMLWTRRMDKQFMALQRQGVLGFYAETLGQEAASIGSAAALEPQDWLVPALREHGSGLFRGMNFDRFVAQLFGNCNDVTQGRQMPLHPSDRESNYVNMSSVIGTQIPHAVGVAMGMKASGHSDKICIGYMGDGATSEGDFHAGMNFAAVRKVPVVMLCQNNQWAISTAGAGQTAAETIALKGLGYGMESLRADGNDILAVYEVTKYAADKARRGGGPTFIELLTYRVSAHTSSDDPSRYRDESVTAVWREKRDPLLRMRLFLQQNGWLSEPEHEAMAAQIDDAIRATVAAQRDQPGPALESLVEDVFENPWWRLKEEIAKLLPSS